MHKTQIKENRLFCLIPLPDVWSPREDSRALSSTTFSFLSSSIEGTAPSSMLYYGPKRLSEELWVIHTKDRKSVV